MLYCMHVYVYVLSYGFVDSAETILILLNLIIWRWVLSFLVSKQVIFGPSNPPLAAVADTKKNNPLRGDMLI